MKRTATANSSSSYQPIAPGAPDPTPPDAPTLPPRARMPDGSLVSLAEAPQVQGNRTLELVLSERVAYHKENTPHHAMAHLWDAAVELILALDQRDQTPDAKPATCQIAAELLLATGQAWLLLRLAQMNKAMHFLLEVGANPVRADALARIGASWPKDVAVTIQLDAHLPTDALLPVHAFVQCPSRLSLHVLAHGKDDLSAARVMGQVVGKRELQALSLEINGYSVPVLQGLCGVKAQSICIVNHASLFEMAPSTPPESAPEGKEAIEVRGSVSRFTDDQIACYQSAAVDLVRGSGAQVLRLPQSHLDEALCVRLLACRSDWETVEFNMTDCAAIVGWLSAGQQTVRRLELSTWMPGNGAEMSDLLGWAAKNGVHTIVFHDTVSLRHLAEGLDKLLLQSTHVFEWIEACFVLDADQPHDEEFENEVLAPLLSNPLVETLRHKPLAELPSAESLSPDGVQLGDDDRVRLNTMSALNRLVSPAERLALVQRAVEKRRQQLVEKIGFLLSLEDASALIDELSALPPPLVQRKGSFDDMPLFESNLSGMFAVLDWFGVEAWLVKGAVAQCVHNQPLLGPRLSQAVMGSRLPLRHRAPEEWQRLGALHARTWLSEDVTRRSEEDMKRHEDAVKRGENVKRPEGIPPGTFALIAPPVPHDPNAMVSSVPAADATADKPPAAQVQPTHADPLHLVTPSSSVTFVRLQEHFEERALAQPAGTPPSKAIELILGLLKTGAFDPDGVKDMAVRSALSRELLEAGQGRLLKHIIQQHIIHRTPLLMQWFVDVGTPEVADALVDLSPWPEHVQCICVLRLGVDLPHDAGQKVVGFASAVKPEQLMLGITVSKSAAAEALKDLINGHAGLHLALIHGAPVDVDATVALLNGVQSTTALRKLTLQGVQSDDTRLVKAVVDLIDRIGVENVDVLSCGPTLARTVATHRRWKTLGVESVASAKELFESGLVSAENLSLIVQQRPGEDVKDCVRTMVARCHGARFVETHMGSVDAYALAQGLQSNSSVRSVKAGLMNNANLKKGVSLLQRNTSIVEFELSGNAIGPATENSIRRMVQRNRLRHRDLFAIGAGRGWGWRVGGFDMIDVGGRIGSMLEPKDAIALSLTSKAAYYASRRPWEIEIARLARLFAIESPDKFKADLVRQLSHLDERAVPLSGKAQAMRTAQMALMPASTLLEKVAVMQFEGVPDLAIGDALHRVLKADPASSGACLEAMVVVGAYPAEVWLRDIADIDVRSVGAPKKNV